MFHMGLGVGGGHYTAVAKEQEKWVFLNDSHVSCKDRYIHQAHKSKDSYLLFYILNENWQIVENKMIVYYSDYLFHIFNKFQPP